MDDNDTVMVSAVDWVSVVFAAIVFGAAVALARTLGFRWGRRADGKKRGGGGE